jgi:hypothetical protein
MNVNMKTSWVLEVDGREMTLLSKALTCTLKPAERKPAHELAVRLAEMRLKESATNAAIAEGAFGVVSALPQPEGEEP